MARRLARTIGSVTSTVRAARPAAYSPARLALTALLVLALTALGFVAGNWQWGRYETRADAKAAYDAAKKLPTAELGTVLSPDDASPGDATWRTVTVTGEIEPTGLVALRGRSVDGTATLQYLAWLRTDGGESVLLNLGWTPRAQPVEPTLPGGAVTVTGIVRPLEPDNGREGTRITDAQVPGANGPVYPAYLMVEEACGDAGCVEGIEPVPVPQLSLGPHFSYALQWWLLMVAAAPIAVILTRREAQKEGLRAASADETTPEAPGPNPGTTRPQRRPTDEEIEDAL